MYFGLIPLQFEKNLLQARAGNAYESKTRIFSYRAVLSYLCLQIPLKSFQSDISNHTSETFFQWESVICRTIWVSYLLTWYKVFGYYFHITVGFWCSACGEPWIKSALSIGRNLAQRKYKNLVTLSLCCSKSSCPEAANLSQLMLNKETSFAKWHKQCVEGETSCQVKPKISLMVQWKNNKPRHRQTGGSFIGALLNERAEVKRGERQRKGRRDRIGNVKPEEEGRVRSSGEVRWVRVKRWDERDGSEKRRYKQRRSKERTGANGKD